MDDQQVNEQKQLQDSYFSQLGYQELIDRCFTGGTRNAVPFIFLMLGFPFFVAGALINIIPYLFGRYMADQKVTRADFYTSVLVAVSAFSYVIWLLIWMIVGVVQDNDLILLVFAFSPFLAWIALWWMDEFKKWKFQNRFDTLSSSEPDLIKELAELRSRVRDLDPDHRPQLQVS
jgi:hypothetical protein